MYLATTWAGAVEGIFTCLAVVVIIYILSGRRMPWEKD